MKYYLFIDESGDHGLTSVDLNFPVFVLCGVLIDEIAYRDFVRSTHNIKWRFWGNRKVIFHSSDIRKCEKEFVILFDQEVKALFYEHLSNLLAEHPYTVIAAAIRKDKYIERYGKLSNDVYELALSFIIERAVFFLDGIHRPDKTLEMVIERRGKREDQSLHSHYQRLMSRGTGFVSRDRLIEYALGIRFKKKIQDISGLQLADLIAYPIARYVIDPQRANPTFDIINPKIYSRNGQRYGLKIYP